MSFRITKSSTPEIFILKRVKQGISLSSYAYSDETDSATDEVSFGITKFFSDSVTVTESIRTETVVPILLSDSFSPIDLVGIEDGVTYSLGKYLSDTVTLSDSAFLLRTDGTSAADAFSFSDAISTFGIGKSLTDNTSAVTDALIYNLGKVLADSSNISEAIAFAFSKSNIADSSSISESFFFTISPSYSDSASIADAASGSVQDYFLEAYMSPGQIYVEKANYTL